MSTPTGARYIFDFGRPEVRNFLVANALYWCAEFHVDGLRVDAVASMLYLDYSREEGEWLPNIRGGRENLDAVAFMQEANATVYKHHPGVMMIAEESTAWPGVTRPTDADGLGFGFKWNMGWMHDTLVYIGKEPVHRQWHHNQMTFAAMYAWSENFILPISHDEVVHGKASLVSKVPGDGWQQRATLRALLAFMWSFPGKQLLFMGSELADPHEWSEQRGLDWGLLEHDGHAGVAAWSGTSTRPTGPTRTVDAGHDAGRVRLDRRRRRRQQRVRLRALRFRRLGPGLCGQLRGHPPRQLPARPAPAGALGGDRQHRRADLRRLRCGQPRRGAGRRVRLARPAGVGDAGAPAAGRAVAAPGRRALMAEG